MDANHSSHFLSGHYGKGEFVIRDPNGYAVVFAKRL